MNAPQVLAAPAPAAEDNGPDSIEALFPESPGAVSDDHLDELCEQLVWWCRTRRLYGSPRLPSVNALGRMRLPTRPLRPQRDVECSAELAALYIALSAQPIEALDRQVFELHYFARVGNVKVVAAMLQIGRQHWYTLLKQFRRRIFVASRDILAINQAALRDLPPR